MATPLGRLPVWTRQSTLFPAAFRMLSSPDDGSRVARNTWLPPRLTITNLLPARLASMATMSLPNVLSRLGGGAAVSTSICLFRFWASHLKQGTGVYPLTRACTFVVAVSGGSGWAPMLGRYRRLPRINADRSWLGKTPCGLFAFTGSSPGKSGSGQKMRE